MSNRRNRRANQLTNCRNVSKSKIRRGKITATLILLIPVLLLIGLAWHTNAAGQTIVQSVALTPSEPQDDSTSFGDVPTSIQPLATAQKSKAIQSAPLKPKNEIYLELDMSQGNGNFTAWRLEPSDKLIATEQGNIKQVGQLQRGDLIHMSQGLIGLVTKAEKYVDPRQNSDNKPNADGNIAERVIGWSKHVTNILLNIRTTDEIVTTTPEHPFFVHGKGWVKAGALQPGEQIETDSVNKLVSVISTEIQHKLQAVYNLDVENNHNFYVGKDKLLVHNGDCVPELEEAGEYLAAKAPKQVTPGTRILEGQHVDDLGRVQPWTAHYDEFGRLIGRTDYNASNKVMGYEATHYHTYGGYRGNPSGWGGQGPIETGSHIPGEYIR